MPRFAANISMLFTEQPLIERFAAAAAAGFERVEIQFPYELAIPAIAEALSKNKLSLELINLPAGDWAAGERGIACHPDRIEEFQTGVRKALEYADALGVRRINCLSGVVPENVSQEDAERTFVNNLRFAATTCAEHGVQLLAEAINTEDLPGFFLNKSKQFIDLVDLYDIGNLRLQYDVYHMQIMEGNLIRTLERNIDKIGHIQIADVPGRHEPGTGEINFPNLFKAVDAMGYCGVVSFEYIPATDTLSGLADINEMMIG